MDVSLWVWVALLVGILAMLAVDLFMHRDAHVIGVREAAVWSGIWVVVAIAGIAAAKALRHCNPAGTKRIRHSGCKIFFTDSLCPLRDRRVLGTPRVAASQQVEPGPRWLPMNVT